MPDDNALRLQILRKAQQEFFTHGFSKVTTDELATALGISKQSVSDRRKLGERIIAERLAAAVGIHHSEAARERAAITAAAESAAEPLAGYRARHAAVVPAGG